MVPRFASCRLLDSIVAKFKGLHDKVELSSPNMGKHRTNHIASNPEMRLSEKCGRAHLQS